ncbi:MAG: hypothetical protein KAH30_02995, partial [Caldisericia bacterium]|nr:hypothetical protein [Caldisericia bacterium]
MAEKDKVVAEEEKVTTFPISDVAIDAIEKDEFGFAEQAGRLAKLVAGENSPENIAVGVSGSWGSGKSSMLNLIKCYLTDPYHYHELFISEDTGTMEEILKGSKIKNMMPIVVEFDPWFFGSEEKIIDAFFLRLAKSITNNGKIRKGTG